MIKITGDIAGFRRALRNEMARLDRAISTEYFAWADRVFKELVEGSAQWSGNMTANWNYSVGSPSYRYEEIPNKRGFDKGIKYIDADHMFGVFEAGHPLAVNAALSRAAAVKRTTWRDKVFFTNITPTEESGYMLPLQDALASGAVKVRPVNLVEGQVVTMYTIAMKYGGV